MTLEVENKTGKPQGSLTDRLGHTGILNNRFFWRKRQEACLAQLRTHFRKNVP